jgi:hypothetical protein
MKITPDQNHTSSYFSENYSSIARLEDEIAKGRKEREGLLK